MKMFVFPHSGGFGHHYNFIRDYSFENIDSVFNYNYVRKLKPECSIPEEKTFNDRVENAVNWILEHEISSDRFILFGHSLGAFVAYEAGLRLKNEYGLNPEMVIMSSQNPPVVFPKLQEDFRKMHIDIDEFLTKLGGMNSDIRSKKKSMQFYKSLICADLELIDTYLPTVAKADERLEKMLVFYADNDPILNMDLFDNWKQCAVNYKLFEYHGNHFYINSNSDSVLSIIDNELSQEAMNAYVNKKSISVVSV